MIKRIMKPGVAAVALAASALLTPLAHAQDGRWSDDFRTGARSDGFTRAVRGKAGAARLIKADHRRGFRSHGKRNQFGQSYRKVEALKAEALELCRCHLEETAYRFGYKEARLRKAVVEQIGPYGFVIHARARLSNRYGVERQPYDCIVRRGYVRDASQIYPTSHRFGGRRKHRSFDGITLSFGKGWW